MNKLACCMTRLSLGQIRRYRHCCTTHLRNKPKFFLSRESAGYLIYILHQGNTLLPYQQIFIAACFYFTRHLSLVFRNLIAPDALYDFRIGATPTAQITDRKGQLNLRELFIGFV